MSRQLRKTTAPPTARPFTAPIVTCGSASSASQVRLPAPARMRASYGPDEGGRGAAFRSAPAEKARPAPVMITTRAV